MEDEIRLGDKIRTRKPHPCGGDEWLVVRTGADIKIKCLTCGRIVMLDRQVGMLMRHNEHLLLPYKPLLLQLFG